MLIESHNKQTLLLPEEPRMAAQTLSGDVAIACGDQGQEKSMVAIFAHPSAHLSHETSLRARGLLQLPGSPLDIQRNAHREEFLILTQTTEQLLLSAVDALDVRPLWRLILDRYTTPPLVCEQIMIVVEPNHTITGFDLDGHEHWSKDLPDAASCAPTLTETGILVGCNNGDILTVGLDGNIQPTHAAPGAVLGLAEDHAKRIYALGDACVWCLAPGTDAPLWCAKLPSSAHTRFVSTPPGVLYLSAHHRGMFRIAPDGQLEHLEQHRALTAPLRDHSGAVLAATTHSGNALLGWPTDQKNAEPVVFPLSEPTLALWSEPHTTTVLGRNGALVTVRCT